MVGYARESACLTSFAGPHSLVFYCVPSPSVLFPRVSFAPFYPSSIFSLRSLSLLLTVLTPRDAVICDFVPVLCCSSFPCSLHVRCFPLLLFPFVNICLFSVSSLPLFLFSLLFPCSRFRTSVVSLLMFLPLGLLLNVFGFANSITASRGTPSPWSQVQERKGKKGQTMSLLSEQVE